MQSQQDIPLDELPLSELLDLVEVAPHAVAQQRYRDPVMRFGLAALEAIGERRWLCKRPVSLFASQVVSALAGSHPEEAVEVVIAAAKCADDRTISRIADLAKKVGAALPVPDAKYVPSYIHPDTVFHSVADRCFGEGVPSGAILLSECGWVFEARWVEENLHRLALDNQKLCGHCESALAGAK